MIGCVLCKRELQQGECEGWEEEHIGLICPNHKKEEVRLIIELTISKVKSNLKDSLEDHLRRELDEIWPSIYE